MQVASGRTVCHRTAPTLAIRSGHTCWFLRSGLSQCVCVCVCVCVCEYVWSGRSFGLLFELCVSMHGGGEGARM